MSDTPEDNTPANNPIHSRPATLGEFRVGISFNPSGRGAVDQVKAVAAHLIDLIQAIPDHPGSPVTRSVGPADNFLRGERARLKATAMTYAESAAEKAVKAITKGL